MEQKKLWFKAKRYGYGWYPCAWQGWAVLVMYIFSIMTDAIIANNNANSTSDFLMYFFPRLFILTVFLIIICDARGEEARWRWGGKDLTK
jgi:hypothetical protein